MVLTTWPLLKSQTHVINSEQRSDLLVESALEFSQLSLPLLKLRHFLVEYFPVVVQLLALLKKLCCRRYLYNTG